MMRAKQLIKRLVPPLLVDLIRNQRHEFIWDGIYSHRSDVPVQNGVYDGGQQTEEMLKSARHALEQVHAGRNPGIVWHETLAVLTATIAAKTGCVRVLDFGGGIGQSFIQLLATVRNNPALEWHVVELERMCLAGRQLFADDQRIQFHTIPPKLHGSVDIVYVSSVLPYIDDYAAFLREMAGLQAPYLILARLAAGKFQTYAARQLNLPGQVLAYWFLNLDEVGSILGKAGYSLAYDTQVGPEYDQRNFPETHRMGRMRNLLFSRNLESSTKRDQR